MSETDTYRFLHEQIGALFKKLDDVSKVVHDTQLEVAGLKVALAAKKECPHPGLCSQLSVDLNELRNEMDEQIEEAVSPLRSKVEELKSRSDELSGGYKTLMAICVIGPIITAGLVWLITATHAQAGDRTQPIERPAPTSAVVTK